MFTWTDNELAVHLEEARKYRAAIERAALTFDFTAATLFGIGSRESGWGLLLHPKGPEGLGDAGHGHGLMQIDDRSFPDFCAGDLWKDPEENIMKGASVLHGKRTYLASHVNYRMLDRASIAAYNCGEGNIVKALSHKETVDARTAHGNYSADVLARARWFTSQGGFGI